MDDIGFNKGDLYIIDNDFSVMSDSEAIKEQLYVFLNIRSCHKNGDGDYVTYGECEWDQNQGIDFTYVLDTGATESQIVNHYRNRILTYYGDYITEITSMTVEKDYTERAITVNFTYKTIWSNEEQTFKITT